MNERFAVSPVEQALLYADVEAMSGFIADGLDLGEMIFPDHKFHALHYILIDGMSTEPSFVAWLLEMGADAAAVDGNNATALHYAAKYGRGEIAQLLLAAGAPVNANDGYERSALPLAMVEKVPDRFCIEVLLQAGAFQQSDEYREWMLNFAHERYTGTENEGLLDLFDQYLSTPI